MFLVTDIYERRIIGVRQSRGAKTLDDLPANARSYIKYLEEISGAPISAVGVGQDRNATISINDLLLK